MLDKRFFLGMPVPAAISPRLLSRKNAADSQKLRWMRPDQLHSTLAFSGQLDCSRLAALTAALHTFHWPDSFPIRATHAAPFPRAPSRVLAAYLEPDSALITLQSKLIELLESRAIPCDCRAFKPHITLARSAQDISTSAQAINLEFEVSKVVLYQSELGGTGSVYRRLREFNLLRR